MVLDEVTKYPDEFDEMDVEHIRNKDYIIEREELAQLNDQYFPSELFATGFLVRYGVDKKGAQLMGFCNRCYVPYGDVSQDMYDLGRKFLLYFVYKSRIELDQKPRAVYVSAAGTVLENVEFTIMRNAIDFANNYMPSTPGTLLIVDLPVILRVTFRMIVSLLNEWFSGQVVFTTIRKIKQWISYSEIPAYIGGNYENYTRIPDGVKSGKCLKHLSHIPDEDWDTFIDQNIVCIREGMQDVGIKSMENECNVKTRKMTPHVTFKDRVKMIRQKVLDHVKLHPAEFDESDVEHIRKKDYIIERYLKANGKSLNDDKPKNNILKALKFYKKEGFAQLNDSYFPSEFYATGFLIGHGVDKAGAPLLGFCNRCYTPYRDISEDMYDLGRKFILYFVYKKRIELDQRPRTVYVAAEEAHIVNFEIKMFENVVDFVNDFMPSTPAKLLVADLSPIVKLTFKVLTNLLHESFQKSVTFTTMVDIKEWIAYQEIPTYVGGNYENYSRIPDGVKSGKCLNHLKYIPDEDWDAFTDQNIVCIREGLKERNQKSMEKYLNLEC
ncbi:unnamed protein product [Medioppia subpectinata]|uniref:CRAL-TRIO domain-containing protein n=1 Tax=Medioppia subpectinata TaxID=1979941 RepID=A0A7R9Q2F4_9ACAR|nr:unnamed protein product [Medioppia subpectinata]CAG2110114.1 unnamed protein product [Medioppia subpectinata]